MNKFLSLIFRKKGGTSDYIYEMRCMSILVIFLYWCGLWVLNGLVNYVLIISIYPMTIGHVPIIIGICAIASTVGFLAFFAPAGLGVFEVSLIFLLGFYMPTSIATIIALMSRVLRTSSDVACVLITYKF